MDIDKKLLNFCYADFNKKKKGFEDMYEHFKGNSQAMKDYKFETDRTNTKIPVNYIKKFIKEEVSFSVGLPPSYTSKSNNDQIIKDIEYYISQWSASHNINLDKQMLIYSQAFELYYVQEGTGEFMAKIIPPTKGYAYTDDYGVLQFFMYIYKKNFIDTIFIDLYTDTEILHLDSNFKEVAPSESHIFGFVPVSPAILSEEGVDDTIYKDIKGANGAYETNLSDISNEISDTRSSYLVITGGKIEDKDIPDIKKKAIFQIPTKEGKVDYLLKNLNDSFIQNTLSTIEDKMYQVTNHINFNSKIASNVSGICLRNSLLTLENKCKLNQKALEDVIKIRLKFLFIYLGILINKEYDVKDIKIKFTPNLPSDDVQIANIISQLGDRLSDETALELLSFIDNGAIEKAKKAKESEEKENSIGMDLLNDTGNIVDVDSEPIDNKTNGKPIVEPKKTVKKLNDGEA